MELHFLPLLQIQRDLLNTARGFERFKQYLDAMSDGQGDIALPLAAFNPMSKPHVADLLDALLAMDAESVARAALDEAATRLRAIPGLWRVGLVIADDAMGGWTNRYLTDAQQRFEHGGHAKRRFATPLLWTGEAAPATFSAAAMRAQVRAETLAAIYRAAYLERHGAPQTLRAMLTQEGLVGAFAGPSFAPPAGDLAPVRPLLAAHRDTTSFPIAFACLYGDAAATSVGYPPLGVPPWGGFAVALDEARERGDDPVAALQGMG